MISKVLCIKSSNAAQKFFLCLNAAATGVHAVQPWHANFFQQKQEAQSNLSLTQWLSQASRGTTPCFANLSLYFSSQQKHTEAPYCYKTQHTSQDTICLHSQLLYLFTPPPKKKKLPCWIFLQIFVTDMLCCIMQTVETVRPAVRTGIIVNQLLNFGAAGHGNPLGILRAGGKSGECLWQAAGICMK